MLAGNIDAIPCVAKPSPRQLMLALVDPRVASIIGKEEIHVALPKPPIRMNVVAFAETPRHRPGMILLLPVGICAEDLDFVGVVRIRQ